MNIEAGQDLLHYTLSEKIGEGGMGVVWKAVDTTLNRDVAIKILPEGFAAETERIGRFEREAKLLASLNHPNIAGIYGIHQSDGHYFLSMELIDGEDLSQRLSRGALPRAEAMKLALQIAQAFEAAHEQGVIHRDLKPANVKLTPGGQIKVLDFGLAKALSQDASDPGASPSMSPTLTSTGTIAGTLLGTAAYMSPEQAKGKTVDRRADIWSFGVVLYELLTGRRLFEGETISETLAAVILKEIDFGGLPGDTPEAVRRLLHRCLERDPNSRLRDIGEARVRLEEALNAPADSTVVAPAAEQSAGWPPILPWTVAVLALVALVWVWASGSEDAQPEPVMRFTMSLADDQPLDRTPIPVVAISPDGTKIAYVGKAGQERVIYLRHAHQSEATMLKGTENASHPFFSPDGEWIGFFSRRKLKKISILGGPPSTLCDAPYGRGASWGTDGTILLSPDRSRGLALVSEAGGEPEVLTLGDADDRLGAPTDRWPQYLPGNKYALITHSENNNDYTDAEIQAFSLADQSRKTLIKGGTFGRYVRPGILVFMRERTLFAARFDPDTLEVTEPAVPVLEAVAAAGSYGSAHLTFSDDGTMLYVSGSADYGKEQLVWLDQDGTESRASEHQLDYGGASVSPGGTHLALEVISDESLDIWVLELARDTMTRLTFDGTRDLDPIWNPDGEWLTYSSVQEGESVENLYRIRADGTGEPERVTQSPYDHSTGSWSPDGSALFFMEDKPDAATGTDLMTYRPGGDTTVEPYLETKFDEWLPDVSPDGRWMLYSSNRSDHPEIYVRATTGQGQAVRVSTDGSPIGRWMPSGNALVYRNLAGKLMSVSYAVKDGAFQPELPQELFDFPAPPYSFVFDVAPDGRILNYKDINNEALMALEPVVVVNWDDELEAKVPK